MEMEIKYQWTDAWLLAAIANASQKQPAELWEIIAAGDSLNHAIFRNEEIESGLARLTKGEWIQEKTGKFTITEKLKKGMLNLMTVDAVEKILKAKSWIANEPLPHPANNLKYPEFSKEKLRKAYNKYRDRIR